MKKKVLEVVVDENGKYTFESDFNPMDGLVEDDSRSERKYVRILDRVVEDLFLASCKDIRISQIMKLLTTADICANLQPYEQIEELWSTLIYSLLPDREKKYRRMKESHGYRTKVNEPLIIRPFTTTTKLES